MTTNHPRITLTIPAEMEAVWQEAEALLPGCTRSEMVRTLVRAGLTAAQTREGASPPASPPRSR